MNWMRYPITGTEAFPWHRHRWNFGCGVCGDYDGVHLRCWWAWLTDERVIHGTSDGEQQIEPDEPYPSRWQIFVRETRTLFDPRWWRLCWQERMSPWPYGQDGA